MHIAYKLNGNTHIAIPAAGVTYEQLLATVPAGATDITPIEPSNIPTDRTYRDAWDIGANSIAIDMPKARLIHMNYLRIIRNGKLKQLDTDYLKADENSDAASKAAIKTLKQQLRDMPSTYDLSAALTPDALKLMIPDYLEAK